MVYDGDLGHFMNSGMHLEVREWDLGEFEAVGMDLNLTRFLNAGVHVRVRNTL
jgi:hypothetical protein